MKRFYVYTYLDPSQTEEVAMYIGKGSDRRDRGHLSCLNDGTYFHNKLKKLIRQGFDPQPTRLQTNLTEEEAFELEKFLIEQFGRKNLGTGTLYNLTDGGDGASGCKWTDEQLKAQRMSGSRKGKYKGIYEVNGKYIAKISDKHLGTFNTPEEAARAYDEAVIEHWGLDGRLNFPEEWDGLKCLREFVKGNSRELSAQISGSRKGKYKGIYEVNGKYKAQISDKHLGTFNTPEEAARAYDEAVIEHWGLGGGLNFPEEWDGLKCLREFVKRNTFALSTRMGGPRKGRKCKGVYETLNGNYKAKIVIDGSGKHLGTFKTKEEAARAYDEAVIEHWGQGWLNFPNDGDYTGYWDANSEYYQQDYLEA